MIASCFLQIYLLSFLSGFIIYDMQDNGLYDIESWSRTTHIQFSIILCLVRVVSALKSIHSSRIIVLYDLKLKTRIEQIFFLLFDQPQNVAWTIILTCQPHIISSLHSIFVTSVVLTQINVHAFCK